MALVRWAPATELNSLQTEMNRLFTSLFDTPTRAVSAAPTRRFVPAMDLVESDDQYVLRADLPGLSEQDINIELDAGVLTVSGERKSESTEERTGYRRIERSYGSFSRSLTLPEGVDGDAVAASFDKGVLEVRIPKPEQAKPRKVTIAVGASAGEATGETTAAGEAAGETTGDNAQ